MADLKKLDFLLFTQLDPAAQQRKIKGICSVRDRNAHELIGRALSADVRIQGWRKGRRKDGVVSGCDVNTQILFDQFEVCVALQFHTM